MTEFEKSLQNSPADLQGEAPYDEEELATLRRKAWQDHEIFITSINNSRLGVVEQKMLRLIAQRLYGRKDSK